MRPGHSGSTPAVGLAGDRDGNYSKVETLALGFPVFSREGDRLGRLVDVQGEWMVVQSGLFIRVRRGVPKELADVDEAQEEIRLRAAREAVRNSPVIEESSISRDCADRLRAHYERTTVFNFDGSE